MKLVFLINTIIVFFWRGYLVVHGVSPRILFLSSDTCAPDGFEVTVTCTNWGIAVFVLSSLVDALSGWRGVKPDGLSAIPSFDTRLGSFLSNSCGLTSAAADASCFGREIGGLYFGDLEPCGEPNRLTANAATTLTAPTGSPSLSQALLLTFGDWVGVEAEADKVSVEPMGACADTDPIVTVVAARIRASSAATSAALGRCWGSKLCILWMKRASSMGHGAPNKGRPAGKPPASISYRITPSEYTSAG